MVRDECSYLQVFIVKGILGKSESFAKYINWGLNMA